MARKKKELPAVEEITAVEVPEAVYIYHTGDNIEKISQILTGRPYMEYAVLNYSGYNMNTLKDGAVLKWRV